tara:strand:- start:714 stop:947 length:234 start_codon:yes stop_codon:yes gene_type:complete
MKDTLSLKITRELLKIFKLKDKNILLKINRKNFDKWDSLTHLQIIFLLEKNIKKKISIEKLNKVSSVKEIIKILNEN